MKIRWLTTTLVSLSQKERKSNDNDFKYRCAALAST
jgi:hypothetical protein